MNKNLFINFAYKIYHSIINSLLFIENKGDEIKR